jgi:hypothetical protein
MPQRDPETPERRQQSEETAADEAREVEVTVNSWMNAIAAARAFSAKQTIAAGVTLW